MLPIKECSSHFTSKNLSQRGWTWVPWFVDLELLLASSSPVRYSTGRSWTLRWWNANIKSSLNVLIPKNIYRTDWTNKIVFEHGSGSQQKSKSFYRNQLQDDQQVLELQDIGHRWSSKNHSLGGSSDTQKASCFVWKLLGRRCVTCFIQEQLITAGWKKSCQTLAKNK